MERMKVFMLMAGLTALLVVIGGAINGSSGAAMFFIIAAVMNFVMYWWSDKFVLRMYRAQIISEKLFNSVTKVPSVGVVGASPIL